MTVDSAVKPQSNVGNYIFSQFAYMNIQPLASPVFSNKALRILRAFIKSEQTFLSGYSPCCNKNCVYCIRHRINETKWLDDFMCKNGADKPELYCKSITFHDSNKKKVIELKGKIISFIDVCFIIYYSGV